MCVEHFGPNQQLRVSKLHGCAVSVGTEQTLESVWGACVFMGVIVKVAFKKGVHF